MVVAFVPTPGRSLPAGRASPPVVRDAQRPSTNGSRSHESSGRRGAFRSSKRSLAVDWPALAPNSSAPCLIDLVPHLRTVPRVFLFAALLSVLFRATQRRCRSYELGDRVDFKCRYYASLAFSFRFSSTGFRHEFWQVSSFFFLSFPRLPNEKCTQMACAEISSPLFPRPCAVLAGLAGLPRMVVTGN
ncbi:hypothetical protein HPB48_007010 [Haemaphysalis longicornis]|uniref:Uncharacterized protein n=1 Tax=Haemaphysalis longicornis TaxID=44386 RepID=A0A9J6FEY1_HAELO|nr:hypothetical protein HPB48_007010 [Haemaphysalis longicornis]